MTSRGSVAKVAAVLLAGALVAACTAAAASLAPSAVASTAPSAVASLVPTATPTPAASVVPTDAAGFEATPQPTPKLTTAPTSVPTELSAPEAPTGLSFDEVMASPPCSDDDPGDKVCGTDSFGWTRPAGQIDGYYFIEFDGAVTTHSEPSCQDHPYATKLSASATKYNLPFRWPTDGTIFVICAYNAVGISPVAEF